MTDKPGIVVTGASGRMGQTLVKLIMASGRWTLAGAIERTGNPWLGRDIGDCIGIGRWSISPPPQPRWSSPSSPPKPASPMS
jgi:4-hydroxy-tetrahydrodipicolinate reductase